ncbi:type VI toxin-antitoxin system SocA family antitoxin [Agrobacterium fabrum]|uniref:type VI toxin-antitoxin system SocA family antitoxin n=1 Tax=Agrobacterium fabrum TaxID=1176649 RepID=UPI003B9DEC4C
MSGGHDARAVANLMLEEAEFSGLLLTNLSLQKLLYFAHGTHLILHKEPLVSGYFEAWQYGPVHPVVYRSFKEAGSLPIAFRAQAQNPLTGEKSPIEPPADRHLPYFLKRVLDSYGLMSAGKLVELSHAKDSPWAFVIEKAATDVALGLRIPDNVIQERFRYHMVPINFEHTSGDVIDDTPFT